MTTIALKYEGAYHCQATHTPSGRTITTDLPADNGGKGEYFSPTDLVATALGSCMLTIMAKVGERLDVDGMEAHRQPVRLRRERRRRVVRTRHR